jgi:hypothetical protein
MTIQPIGHDAGPHACSISGSAAPASTMPNPTPEPNRMAMASALRRGSPWNSPAASVPAVENDMAPSTPAAMRQNVCHPSAAFSPVASSASVVVTMPMANSRAGEMRRMSSMVSTAPAM